LPAEPDGHAETAYIHRRKASFLALPYDRRAALDNLARLRRDFDAYGRGGFYDAINVDTGQVSRYWLALDQGMVMAALGNELTDGRLQRYFTSGPVERAVRPLLAMEAFTAGG
jgi:Putative glucoamylase